jgi:hypothetical protein
VRFLQRDIPGAHLLVQTVLQLVLQDCIPRACAVCLRPKINNFIRTSKLSTDQVIDLAAPPTRRYTLGIIIAGISIKRE